MPVIKHRNKYGQVKSFWTPSREKKVRKLYSKGLSMRECADKLGCSHSTVQQYLERNSLVRTKQSDRDKTERYSKKIKSLYLKKKMTCAEISKELPELTEGQIYSHIRRKGYDRSLSETFNLISIPKGKHSASIIRRNALLELSSVDLSSLDKDKYITYVRRMTEHIIKTYPEYIEGLEKRSRHYHVDHQFSLFNGFMRWSKRYGTYVPRKKPVTLEIICHPVNLKIMKNKDNGYKGSQNHHSLKKLKRKIEVFNQEHGNLFEEILKCQRKSKPIQKTA